MKIKVPHPGVKQDEAEAKEFEVTGVLHRDLTDIIKIVSGQSRLLHTMTKEST